MTMRMKIENRWMVLGTDGLHVSLSRTEPTEMEVLAASYALAAQGLSG
jgi:glucokinase